MRDWCIAHPWMTFFIAMFAIFVVGQTVTNLLTVIDNRNRLRRSQPQPGEPK